MIEKVSYKEGDIEIDLSGAELINNRADANLVPGKKPEVSGNLGGMEHGSEEQNLKTDLKRTGWNEARKATDVKHTCPVCGTRYWARPNKNYCGTPCKEVAKKRRYRGRKRAIRDFKPGRGKAGEVYFMSYPKGKEVITFVPAYYGDTRARAKKYIEDTYSTTEPEKVHDYIEQVNEVIKR